MNVGTESLIGEAMARERKGFIVQKKGKTYARLTFTDSAGKRHDLMRRADNRTHARELIKGLIRELEENGERSIQGDHLTFAEMACIYSERRLIPAKYVGERKVAGLKSVQPALAAMRALLNGFGRQKIKSITHSDVERYKLMRLDTPTKRGERAIATVNRELELMRAMMRFSKREGWLNRSPFEMGEPLISKADETRRERVLSHNEEERLLHACLIHDANGRQRRLHLHALIICALDTALRRGEMLKLIWRDVDFANRLVRIKAVNSKTARGRTVAMTPRLYEVLKLLWRKAEYNLDYTVFRIKDNIKNSFTSACRDAGIEGFRFHDCRHTAITRMVAAGIAPMEIMKISGHTQMTTFARYVNPTEQTVRKAAEALAAFNSQLTGMEVINPPEAFQNQADKPLEAIEIIN
jgi:integrase